MITFLAAQHTYKTIQFGLFHEHTMLGMFTEDKLNASKNFIPLLNIFLQDQQIRLTDLSFLAANLGPGPFTTLRVVIATMNGLGFASHIPLVGVDGLAAFLDECKISDDHTTVAMLNAFSHDVYFGIRLRSKELRRTQQQGVTRTFGCTHHEQLFAQLADIQTPINFVGNAVSMYREKIEQMFGARAQIPAQIPEHPTLHQIAKNALAQWHLKQTTGQLAPLYLKQYSAVMPQ